MVGQLQVRVISFNFTHVLAQAGGGVGVGVEGGVAPRRVAPVLFGFGSPFHLEEG